MTLPFQIIPVIDLRHGIVVRARAGERGAYAPIHTPLARGHDPAEVAQGLLEAVPTEILYVADLDAIVEGRPPNTASLEAIAHVAGGREIWVDAGFRDEAGVDAFLQTGFGRPVLGSESLDDPELVKAFGDRIILSLDSRGNALLGPSALHTSAELWPRDVIVMTLARVGVGRGPDLLRLSEILRRRASGRVYAAGGVRGPQDVAVLRHIGVAGALVASALHDGDLRREHLS